MSDTGKQHRPVGNRPPSGRNRPVPQVGRPLGQRMGIVPGEASFNSSDLPTADPTEPTAQQAVTQRMRSDQSATLLLQSVFANDTPPPREAIAERPPAPHTSELRRYPGIPTFELDDSSLHRVTPSGRLVSIVAELPSDTEVGIVRREVALKGQFDDVISAAARDAGWPTSPDGTPLSNARSDLRPQTPVIVYRTDPRVFLWAFISGVGAATIFFLIWLLKHPGHL